MKKKTTKTPKLAKYEAELRSILMLQPGEDAAPLQVAPGLTLIGATRSAYILHDLIGQGRFGDKLGRSLLALVPEPNGSPVSDMELRVLHGDGYHYALFVIARGRKQRIALLGFERSGVIGDGEKAEMWRLLGLAEKLVRQLLAEELEGR